MGLDVKYDLREITADVTEWCDEVYPTRTRDQMIAKLREEFQEWLERPLDAWEVADLFIIFLDFTNEIGVDIGRVIAHKMDINRNHRKWAVNEQGILKHVSITRHTAGGDDQAVAHSEHGSGPDQCRAPVQRGDLDTRDLSSPWVCAQCKSPTGSLGACARCRGVQDGGHTDPGQEDAAQ